MSAPEFSVVENHESAYSSSLSLDELLHIIESVERQMADESGSKPNRIDTNLVKHLVNGSKEVLARDQAVNLWELRSHDEDNNTVLHIAATNSSQPKLISDILPISQDLIKQKNSRGDLAFHSAAKAGRLEMLEALSFWREEALSSWREEAGIGPELLGLGNNIGDTPLHIALKNNQPKMAGYLASQYAKACFQLNKKKVSPIYLAVEAGYVDLVKQMMTYTEELNSDATSGDALFQGKSVVHAAIEAQNLEVLKEILKIKPNINLIESYDEEGRTPISYAAFNGYLEGVQFLLKEFPNSAYKCDKNGSFPVHKAASGGHIKVIIELQSTKHLRNRKGQNILHVAAGSGKSEVVSYLLKMKELESLINLKDENGNTPLHLATLGFHPRVVYILTRENKVKLDLKNNYGLTALDVAEIHHGPNPTFEERLTWMALRYADAPRSPQSTRKSYVRTYLTGHNNQNKEINDKKQLKSYKDRINTHLLVATLVATVTFAAGFTLPGGYRQGDPHIGMAVLPNKLAFEVFVICNTAAMYSSILTVVTLMWAFLSDLKLILVSYRLAMLVLGFALGMMSLAFMTGLYVVLRYHRWLPYVVLGIGSFFLGLVLVFFIPLYNPSSIRNSLVRLFFSGSFLLLLLVCEKGKIDDYA